MRWGHDEVQLLISGIWWYFLLAYKRILQATRDIQCSTLLNTSKACLIVADSWRCVHMCLIWGRTTLLLCMLCTGINLLQYYWWLQSLQLLPTGPFCYRLEEFRRLLANHFGDPSEQLYTTSTAFFALAWKIVSYLVALSHRQEDWRSYWCLTEQKGNGTVSE